jgi:hypothetical protein
MENLNQQPVGLPPEHGSSPQRLRPHNWLLVASRVFRKIHSTQKARQCLDWTSKTNKALGWQLRRCIIWGCQACAKVSNIPFRPSPPQQSFVYSKLNGRNDFRVLELYPARKGEPIEGRLITVSSLDEIVYFAVSHTWGDRRLVTSITCDDQQFYISKGVAGLLIHLRCEDVSRLLWIDSICINQTDDSEKEHQVGMMRHIYKKATNVLIWLGGEDKYTKDAIDIIEESWEAWFRAEKRFGNRPSMAQLLESGFPSTTDKRWLESFSPFLQRPWFSRLWILQEVTLAGHRAAVIAGTQWVWWLKLSHLLIVLGWTNGEYSHNLRIGAANNVARISTMSIPMSAEAPPPSTLLVDYLAMSMGCGVSDDRDRIYGLFGLASDETDFHTLVDYKCNVPELFTAVAAHYITQSSARLEMLHLASNSPSKYRKDLPSWTPDFSGSRDAYRSLPIPWPLAIHQCRRSKPKFGEDKRILRITAALQTTVWLTGRRFNFSLAPAVDALCYLESWHDIARAHLPQTDPHTLDEDFARTLISDFWDSVHGPAPGSLRQVYQLYLEQFSRSYSYPELHEKSKYAIVAAYCILLWNVCQSRTFFLTANRRMGLGPRLLKLHDHIVFFHGDPTPFVVRKDRKTGHYRLVGEAYVHNLKHPEPCASADWEEICLI